MGEYSKGKATTNRALAVYKSGALVNVNNVGLPGCLVRDEHSEPSQKEEFGNSSDVGLLGFLVCDKHLEPRQREEFENSSDM